MIKIHRKVSLIVSESESEAIVHLLSSCKHENYDNDDDVLLAMARARTTLVVDLALTAALMLLTALVLVTLCRDECY